MLRRCRPAEPGESQRQRRRVYALVGYAERVARELRFVPGLASRVREENPGAPARGRRSARRRNARRGTAKGDLFLRRSASPRRNSDPPSWRAQAGTRLPWRSRRRRALVLLLGAATACLATSVSADVMLTMLRVANGAASWRWLPASLTLAAECACVAVVFRKLRMLGEVLGR